MNIGFHHHVPTVLGDRCGRVSAFYGMFITELAKQAGSVTYYTFEGEDSGLEDYELREPTVRCVNLGRRPAAPIAFATARRILAKVDLARDGIDALVVRGPGPLVPGWMRKAREDGVPVAALIMGDYRSWRPGAVNPGWRNVLIRIYLTAYMRAQDRALRDVLVIANNPWLLNRMSGEPYAHSHLGFTSSLTQQMLNDVDALGVRSFADGKGRSEPVRLLYTGRLVQEKGIVLMVEALGLLRDRGVDATLELVGWAPDNDPTPDKARARAEELGVSDRLTLSGYVPAGAPLLQKYLDADIFLFAAPTEWGAPHTVQEALAARLPVVTSAIEGLRELLVDGEDALLVEPGSSGALADGVERVLGDAELRNTLSMTGRRWAEEHTNERSAELVLRHVRDWIDRTHAHS